MDPIAELLKRWQEGDPQAAEELFARYAAQLARLAQQHLSRAVRQREDGDDVAQSALRTFFRRSRAGELSINAATDLWRLLVRITILKARARARFHTAGQRDVRRQAGDVLPADALAREPDPADAVAVVDLIEAVLRGQPEVFAEVLHRWLRGDSVTDIAQQLGFSRKTAHQILRRLKARLRALQGQDGP